ncbi:MAG: 1-acyl-sn-glycerol-3-phosphate acyltransferase [Polyangiales bacterium]
MFDADRLDARDPALIAKVLPYARWLNRHYLRLRSDGFDTLPSGPCLYVANHNGGIAGPDVLCTMASLLDAPRDAPLYALAHDFAMRQLPPFGRLVQRFGALRATPANALRALRAGAQVLVYPGGEIDAFRHSRRRNEIVLGARTGFIRVAQQAGVPIVPIVAHGAHRSAYIFHEGEALSRWLRTKHWSRTVRFPLALALPWGLTLGPWLPYMPLPFPVRLRALPSIDAPPEQEPAALQEQVRRTMQDALDELAR